MLRLQRCSKDEFLLGSDQTHHCMVGIVLALCQVLLESLQHSRYRARMLGPRPNLNTIRRILARVKATPQNKCYPEWQTARASIVIADLDPQRAVHRALNYFRQQGWVVLELERTDTLIEERVQADGCEVWGAYLRAAEGETVLEVWHSPGTLVSPKGEVSQPVQISEPRFDQIVIAAGGQRVTDLLPQQDQLNADYVLGDTVFELKTLEENGLESESRQVKLAELFGPYYPDGANALIDPGVLTKDDYRRYLDILGSCIKTHIKKASKQVKATKAALGESYPRGGLILLNIGFPALSHDVFAEQVHRYATKDSNEFDDIVSISVWVNTNGFDSVVNYRFEPRVGGSCSVVKLQTAFVEQFEKIMTDLMRGAQLADASTMVPSGPSSFAKEGLIFRWEPPMVPLSIGPTSRGRAG